MAKKKATQQDLIEGWDGVHPQVKRACTELRTAATKKAEGAAAFKTKQQNLIDKMKEHECLRVRWEDDKGNYKYYDLDQKDQLRITAAPKPSPDAEDVNEEYEEVDE